jgi:hypothetical protein
MALVPRVNRPRVAGFAADYATPTPLEPMAEIVVQSFVCATARLRVTSLSLVYAFSAN